MNCAVTTTEWVPSGKKLPDGGLAVAVTGPSTRSVALTENKTIAPRLGILPLRTVMFDGTVITGGVVSSVKKLSGAVPVPPAPVLLMARIPVTLLVLPLALVAMS